MPELPEVQTVLNTLEKKIKNRKITDIEILYKPIVETDKDVFCNKLIGQHFRKFKRRGKYLLFEMDDITLVSHLRMEGKYFILDEEYPLSKHDHVIFYLDNGKQLRYNDVRKFGRMELIEKDKDYHVFKNLGPEPFSEYFNYEYCKKYLHDIKLPIKQVLLDQNFVAGIGNIYADEILFSMKINPNVKACNLISKDINNLIKYTQIILSKAIEKGGTTIRSYTSSLGVTGRFQLDLNVHTKDKCSKCKAEIKKIVVGGRGTYYCPNCQKNRKRIAITGNIGSGKTEVSNYLREKGFYVFNCDEVNSQLLNKNKKGYLAVKKIFPNCFLNDELDKKKLANIVFNNPKYRKELESIMHPLIIEEMFKQMDKHELFFAEVPLLFEVGWQKYFDTSLLVCSDIETTIKRLKIRGLNKKEALARINNQMSVDKKSQLASQIIYNNGSLDDLHNLIDEFLNTI